VAAGGSRLPALRSRSPSPADWTRSTGRSGRHLDRQRRQAERDCTDVCPNDVFEIRRIEPDDFGTLGLTAKVKVIAHRRLTAYTPNADACRACGLCVVARPEDAISLVPPAGVTP
jgi:NAD-dependent dihydropyrimidine dehydrogenase PreA subunit